MVRILHKGLIQRLSNSRTPLLISVFISYTTIMKKLIVALGVFTLVLFTFSCAAVDPAKKYPNMVADMDPVSAGTIEAEFDRIFSSKLNKVTIETIFYPRENSVALEFRYELVRYRQFWNEQGRKQFIDALNKYKEDYTSRNLVTKYGKSRAIYGKVKGKAEWESFKFTTTHKSSPAIELGYRFRNDTPFFAILQRSAKEEGVTSVEAGQSLQINMYFTRAQAEDLAKIFEQAYLLGLLGRDAFPDSTVQPIEDEYNEYNN
jgi:hypothetical protein